MNSGALIVFSDLDGCLLDKQTYSADPAIPVIRRLIELSVPIVLASSKTHPEMQRIASELQLAPAPIICENGGAIHWADDTGPTVLGTPRATILQVLTDLKPHYKFRSFRDLGLEGVMNATQLPKEKAELALQRNATEPLLWDDKESRFAEFAHRLTNQQLTITRGGRFFHVSGANTKGTAMQRVIDHAAPTSGQLRSIAIGDSPIDASMLEIADFPIIIPQPDGSFLLDTNTQRARVATSAGPKGWAECVSAILNEIPPRG